MSRPTDDAFINRDHAQEAVVRYSEHLTHGRAIRSAPEWMRALRSTSPIATSAAAGLKAGR